MNKKQIKATIASAILGVLSPLAMVAPASAATVTWTGTGDGGFNSALNWGGGVLVGGDTAVFPSSGLYQSPSNDGGNISLVKIIFNGNVSGSSSKSYSITGDPITLASGIDAVMTGSGGDHSLGVVLLALGADQTFKTTGSNTLSIGAESTTLSLDTYDLTLDASGGTISLIGEITGSGNIIKAGTGKVQISTTPGTDGYTGSISVPSGELTATGTLGDVTLTGGTLKGTGTVGDVTMSSGAVAPGASPGVLNTGNLVYTGGTYAVELGGTGTGEFDQTNVTGTVALGTATNLTIALTGGYAPEVNDSFIIVNNDGEDAVTGTFDGLADGDKIIGDYTYQINYDGGDGNDIVLLVTGNPAAPDTGVGSLITNPYVTLSAAAAVLIAVGAIRFAELKKAKVRN